MVILEEKYYIYKFFLFQLHHQSQHGGGWSRKINEYMCLKLSLVNEIVAEIPLLQMQLPNETDGLTSSPSVENFIGQQSSIMACLALIGGYDLRPRLGGTMVHLDTGALGVVRKITAMSGKLQLQMLDGKCAT